MKLLKVYLVTFPGNAQIRVEAASCDVDNGTLIFYDADGHIVQMHAPGEWKGVALMPAGTTV